MRKIQKRVWEQQIKYFQLPDFPHYWVYRLQSEAGELAGVVDKLWRSLPEDAWDHVKRGCRDPKMVLDGSMCSAFTDPVYHEKLKSELADVVIFACLTASMYGLDLEGSVLQKLEYNEKRLKKGYYGHLTKSSEKKDEHY